MKSPIRQYLISDEMLDVIFDRLSRFKDDQDADAVGKELGRQQNFNPNHLDK